MAQNKYSDIIKLQANSFAEATKKNNFKEIVNLTYPKLVSLLGGKDTLTSIVSNNMVLLQREGLQYKSIQFNEPQKVYTYQKELHCLIPQKIIQSNSQGVITRNTFLYAVSNNLGKSWFFMNETQFRKYKNKLFPQLNNEMVIPENNSTYTRNKKFSSFDKPN